MLELPFGLQRRPFPALPDLSCYYPATSHEACLHRLSTGLDDGEGILLLTAEPGTGKTLLCQSLLERLGDGLHAAFLTHTHLADRSGLLQAILYDFSLPHAGKGEQELRLALVDHLIARFSEGKRTLILVDEAHLLSVDLLEELRLLSNLEGQTGKAVQIVLVGQPTLLETLKRPELTSLRQRMAVRTTVEPLSVEEAVDYVLHHLRAAGGKAEQIIGEEALGLIGRATGGIPRLLNQVMHQALRLAAEAGCDGIDAEAALAALAVFDLAVEEELTGTLLGEEEEPAEEEPGREEPTAQAPETACRLFIAPARTA